MTAPTTAVAPGRTPPAVPRATPLAGSVTVTARPDAADGTGLTAATAFTVAADEPVLPGHYPGFPIFPGICLVEYVHTSALATVPGGPGTGPQLAAIESTRFTGAVYPGDELTAELAWKQQPDGWQCKAVVRSPRGDAARVRLRYRTTTAPAAGAEGTTP
ncbi:hypothetical protein AB0D04_19490 [Streptomyces sp. NPDC048483]|uniref:hypothetical protein n=1 Tax=Streptomyces sp. NPDC048483 TaxID=3154927 RepID=UPI003434F597